ncbi:hypothetical protein TNCV_4288601 [Trichonephila clavipes]|nr:hypothetical protein TNCV_4288601 [Trichonephila clavipes]
MVADWCFTICRSSTFPGSWYLFFSVAPYRRIPVAAGVGTRNGQGKRTTLQLVPSSPNFHTTPMSENDTSHYKGARELLMKDLRILNYDQVTWTTSVLPPNFHITPVGGL